MGEGPHEQLSITGRSTVPFDPDYDRLAHAIQREGLRNGRRVNQNGNHNAVDIARIQAGIDVRTTVSSLAHSQVFESLTNSRSCSATSQIASIRQC